MPILKVQKPSSTLSSYKRVFLILAACKAVEHTGFWRQRCAADSLSDVVSALEHARTRKEAAVLVLLDVQNAFDGLPHLAVRQKPAALGVQDRTLCFVQGFLSGRFFRVRVGHVLIYPQLVSTEVPQGFVVSPVLLARLPAVIPSGQCYPVPFSKYAYDVALWNWGSTRNLRTVRSCLQSTLNSAFSHIASVGLTVSPAKMEAFFVHPRSRTRRRVARITIKGTTLSWESAVTHLGLRINHRVSWAPAIKEAIFMMKRTQKAVKGIFLSGRGCSSSWVFVFTQKQQHHHRCTNFPW
nr:uncharacterized protein LOC119177873 [Rhipicephalus microplus]